MDQQYTLAVTNKNLALIYEVLSNFNWHYGKKLSNRFLNKIKAMKSKSKTIDPLIDYKEQIPLNINDVLVFRSAMNTYYQTSIKPKLDIVFNNNSIDPLEFRAYKQALKNEHKILVDTIFQLMISS